MDEWRVVETDQSLRSAERIMAVGFGIGACSIDILG